ncbi:MAG: hypothetical protein MJY82_04160 [Fibrobacter sp.]|nr:hypothetical protein [Fibrobacter sp.]
MMRILQKILLLSCLLLAFWACSQDDDGPLALSSENVVYSGKGFFVWSDLDSGKIIHLAGDTLYMHLDSIWMFSNCALQKIGLVDSFADTVLFLMPQIHIKTTNEDCAAPYYGPDTTIKVLIDEKSLKGISLIKVKNSRDSILDSIVVRRGEIKADTFEIYIDTLFDSVHSLPLRTVKSPSILKVVDSMTPRVFLWRTMKTKCELRVDMCKDVVYDTLYPSSWRMGDTNLIPVRAACADSDSVYCLSSRWVNDSTSLGKVQERPDTIWYTSTYYMETIPECGAVDQFNKGKFKSGTKFVVGRNLYTPAESEQFCGPSTRKNLYVYDLGRNRYVADTVDVDSLYSIWKSATVAKKK